MSTTPQDRCPKCGITPAGTDVFSGIERQCSFCTRWETIRDNAKKARQHVEHSDAVLERGAFVSWANEHERVCYSCGIPERLVRSLGAKTQTGNDLARLGIDRMNNARGYEADNIAWCCFPCNKAKSSTFTSDEMRAYIGPGIARAWRDRLAATGVEDEWIGGR